MKQPQNIINKAIIVNIDPFSIEDKIQSLSTNKIFSNVETIQRFDMLSGYHFIQPIYISGKFQYLFEEISRLSSSGEPFLRRGIFLIIKRERKGNVIILKKTKEINLKIFMNAEQTKSMIKVLRAGGLKITNLLRKTETSYQNKEKSIIYTIYTFSHMSAFLEVSGTSEEAIVVGLAAVDITINRAIINTSMRQLLSKYHVKRSYELLQFLI